MTPPKPTHLSARRRRTIALLCSIGLHGAVYLAYTWVAPPDLELDLELEDDLEFGLDQAMMTTLVTAPPTEPPSAEPSAAVEPPDETPLPPLDAGVPPPPPPDATPPPDAAPPSKPDAAPPPDAEPPSKPDAAPPSKPDAAPPSAPDAAVVAQAAPDAAAPPSTPDAVLVAQAATDAALAAPAADAGAPSSAPVVGLAASAPPGVVALPAGAQIALRLDLAAIRASPLATETSALLAAIPDWQRLLDGAGVDPVTALDRVVIATPSLSQTRMVLAGALAVPGPALVRNAVQSLAKARGVTAGWTMVDSRPVAPWPNPDDVVRHVALLDERHFAIARLEDLPIVLALAQARQTTPIAPPSAPGLVDAGVTPAPIPLSGPEALLWMPADTVASLEIDGARRLLRGQPTLAPTALRVALVTLTGERVRLESEGRFPDAAQAEAALLALKQRQQAALQNPLTMIALGTMGLHTGLRDLVLETTPDGLLRAQLVLTHAQVRGLLTYVRNSLEARARRIREAASAPPSSPSTPLSSPSGPPLSPTRPPTRPKPPPTAPQ